MWGTGRFLSVNCSQDIRKAASQRSSTSCRAHMQQRSIRVYRGRQVLTCAATVRLIGTVR